MTNKNSRTNVFAFIKSWCRPTAAALGLAAVFTVAASAVAASYTWNVTSGNWSAPASWNPSAGIFGPLAADSVIFGNTGASASSNTVNNVVDAAFAGTVANLTNNSVSLSPFLFQVTQIPSGKTLTVTNRVLIGGLAEGAGPYLTYAFLNGPGTFKVTGSSLTVANYGSASSANTYATLDLSGLTNFVFSNPLGSIGVADTLAGLTRAGGNLVLASVSNSITATNINLATSTAAQAGPTSTLTLGAGTNIINVATFNIANNKNPGNVVFAAPTGGLRIRGVTGTETSRANITIGNRNQTGTGTTTGSFVAIGNPLDIKAGTLTIGANPNTGTPGTGGDFGVGVMTFDTGTVDATSVMIGSTATVNIGRGVGQLTVGPNGTLNVGTGGIALLNQTVAEDATHFCTATLNISNGTVICNGNLAATANVGTGAGGPGTNSINFINGGKLSMGAGCFVGTPAFPIGSFNLIENSTLQFAAPSTTQPNIVVSNLVWPANDSLLTIGIGSLPATAKVGSTIPIIQFTNMSGGVFAAPAVTFPAGVTGTVSSNNNTILVTIDSSIYPSLTTISPSLTTLCTNKVLSTIASSTVSTITNVQVIVTTTTLGGLATNTVTNSISSPLLTVTGLGTATANISYALATNTVYLSTVVKVTDANGVTVALTAGKFDTLVPNLIIEASDFNYSGGQFIDTPANGGLALYFNLVGSSGVDEQKAVRAGVNSYYRPADAVVIQNANPGFGPSPTEQKFVSAAAEGDSVNVEQEVGFNTPGDWLNYTRTFGPGGSAPAGTYNVWCYLATSGSGVQSSFSQVTSDPTQPGQTTNFLGTFGTATFTDNGFNNYVYVPLVDQFGNRVALTIGSGQQTFKATVIGNPNIAYYALMPVAPVLTPQVLNVYPDGAAPYQATNKLSFVVGPAQGAAINTNGIHLVLNGVDVSSGLTFSLSGGNWIATYAVPTNLVYTAIVTATNTAGLFTSYSFTFDTFDMNSFQWEAVDYDFSTNNGTGIGGTGGSIGDGWTGGLFIDNPAPSGDNNAIPNNGTIQLNSYWYWPTAWTIGNDGYGAIAHQGVDINWPTNANQGLSEANAAYRYPDGVGSQIATDYLRYKFLVAQTNFGDPAICQYNIGYFYASNWLNYTRTFPTNSFNIWARLAGGGGAFSGATLSRVSSGVGTSNQTTQVLGTFSDPSPAGWQVYHTIPLLDTNGNVAVVHLSGQATLRFTSPTNATSASGALNALYFMLTPAVAPPQFNVSAAVVASQISISIPTQLGHNYTVWYTSSLQPANWTLVGSAITGDGAVHVVTPPATGAQGFYRVLSQ